MHFAFCLIRYFPFSGLARDMLRVARFAVERGHRVTILTARWEGDEPAGITIKLLPASGHSNHARTENFARRLTSHLATESFDAVVGFNKLPGLDVYYAADGCFTARAHYQRHPLYRLTPRYRGYRRLENAVFAPDHGCHILALSEAAIGAYQEFHLIPDNRFTLLPTTLDAGFGPASAPRPARSEARAELGLGEQSQVLLLVGSGFKTKGVDRAIRALAAIAGEFPDAVLLVAGRGDPGPFVRLARSLGVDKKVRFLGGRDDIHRLFSAADVLVHPARNENTGAVIIEAIVSGLPVLATGICGYAAHIERAGSGLVLGAPFEQREFNRLLRSVFTRDRSTWSQNGLRYGENRALYGMPEAAVTAIERIARDMPTGKRPNQDGDLYLARDFDAAADLSFEGIMHMPGELYRRGPARQTLRIKQNNRWFYLKRHSGAGWGEIFKNLCYLRLPVLGAGNEWHGGHALRRIGVRTPRAVGYGRRGGNPAKRESFIITEEVKNAVSLEQLCKEWSEKTSLDRGTIRHKRALIERVAAITRALHRSGYNHRDYYLCHFLLSGNDAADPNLFLIDLHRMQIRRRTPARWVLKDLSGLYFSALDAGLTSNDLWRFVRRYENQTLDKALSGKTDWRYVQTRAFKLYRRHRQKHPADSAADSLTMRNSG